MKQLEMLKKAMAGKGLPYGWIYCFNEQCVVKDECVRFLSTRFLSEKRHSGNAVFPSAWRNGNCQYYEKLRIAKLAWGFDHLYCNVTLKDAPTLRCRLRGYSAARDSTIATSWDNFCSCRSSSWKSRNCSTHTATTMWSSTISRRRLFPTSPTSPKLIPMRLALSLMVPTLSLMMMSPSVMMPTLSLRKISPSVTFFIGEFRRVPTLRAIDAQPMGNECPNYGHWLPRHRVTS